MDMTVHFAEGLSLIQRHREGSQTNYTTLIIKHRDGEFRIDLFSKDPLTFQLGEENDN
jgi:hypothetical protein